MCARLASLREIEAQAAARWERLLADRTAVRDRARAASSKARSRATTSASAPSPSPRISTSATTRCTRAWTSSAPAVHRVQRLAEGTDAERRDRYPGGWGPAGRLCAERANNL